MSRDLSKLKPNSATTATSSFYVRTPNGQAQVTPKLTDLGFFKGRLWLQTLGNKSRKLLRRGWGLC